MGFVDKSSRGWVSTDKKVGQDAKGKCCGLDWGKFYYVAISVENLKNNIKILLSFCSYSPGRYWAREQQNNNEDYSTIIWDSQFW